MAMPWARAGRRNPLPVFTERNRRLPRGMHFFPGRDPRVRRCAEPFKKKIRERGDFHAP
jgi:hypothetical protein